VSKLSRFINIGLHSATLGTRFLFIFFLAKFLDPSLVGYYGLFAAAVGYALYFVGLDFYTYVTRELIKNPVEYRGQLLKNQAALSATLYLFLSPPAFIFLLNSGWPDYLIWWFFPILFLEYFNQEMSRYLVAMSEQITASCIHFFRQGSWALLIVALMMWNTSARHLEVVITLWALAGVVSAVIGIRKLRQLKIGGWRNSVNWGWVKKGVYVSFPFLVATLALRGIHTIDRYWLEALGGIEMVGAYVILLGVASSLLTFLDAGLFAFAYPSLIKLSQQGEYPAVHAKVQQIFLQTLIFCATFALLSWLALPHVLGWIGNPIYLNAQHWYPWLLGAMVLNAVSMIPHYALYASGQDRHIIYSHIAALIVFVLSVWVLSRSQSALAIPLGLNFAFALILIWKSASYWQYCMRLPLTQSKTTPQVLSNRI
jgi:O-antigen/teichoic acid export membrane protein